MKIDYTIFIDDLALEDANVSDKHKENISAITEPIIESLESLPYDDAELSLMFDRYEKRKDAIDELLLGFSYFIATASDTIKKEMESKIDYQIMLLESGIK